MSEDSEIASNFLFAIWAEAVEFLEEKKKHGFKYPINFHDAVEEQVSPRVIEYSMSVHFDPIDSSTKLPNPRIVLRESSSKLDLTLPWAKLGKKKNVVPVGKKSPKKLGELVAKRWLEVVIAANNRRPVP